MKAKDKKAAALELAQYLARAVDYKLMTQLRDPADPPTDGQIAVEAIFTALDRMNFEIVKRRR